MHLKNSKIIVIKIGSSLLVDENKKSENGYQVLQKTWKTQFKEKENHIVSSGAIALGCKKMNYNKTNLG